MYIGAVGGFSIFVEKYSSESADLKTENKFAVVFYMLFLAFISFTKITSLKLNEVMKNY